MKAGATVLLVNHTASKKKHQRRNEKSMDIALFAYAHSVHIKKKEIQREKSSFIFFICFFFYKPNILCVHGIIFISKNIIILLSLSLHNDINASRMSYGSFSLSLSLSLGFSSL